MVTITVGANQDTGCLEKILGTEFGTVYCRALGSYTCLELPGSPDLKPRFKLTHILTRLIFDHLAEGWLRQIIVQTYGYFDRPEQEEIMGLARRLVKTCPSRIYHLVHQALVEYLAANQDINLEGFIRFRAKDYWSFLAENVDAAVDAYLLDREYQEFIKLLRYFVELQEPKTDLVNVIIGSDDRFKILDAGGRLIETDYLEGIILEIGQNELDFEDLLISALISIAPAKIVLHVFQRSRSCQTIMNIFGKDRVSLCRDGCCLICKEFCKHKKGK